MPTGYNIANTILPLYSVLKISTTFLNKYSDLLNTIKSPVSEPFSLQYKISRARVVCFFFKEKLSRNGIFDMGCCSWFIWSFPEVHAEHAVYSSNSSWQRGLYVGHFFLSIAFSSAIWIITKSSWVTGLAEVYCFNRKNALKESSL